MVGTRDNVPNRAVLIKQYATFDLYQVMDDRGTPIYKECFYNVKNVGTYREKPVVITPEERGNYKKPLRRLKKK